MDFTNEEKTTYDPETPKAEASEKPRLSPPWVTWIRKLSCLFAQDPEVRVKFDEDGMEVVLYVDNPMKADALDLLLPSERVFGNVALQVTVVPTNEKPAPGDLLHVAFAGNPALRRVEKHKALPAPLYFAIFEPEVVQFYNDNIASPAGITSALYEDIAREVLNIPDGVFCSTAPDMIIEAKT